MAQPGYDPYAPPQFQPPAAYEGERPSVVLWAKLYALAFTLMYLACAIGGIFILVAGSDVRGDPAPVMIQGGIMVALGFPLMALSIVAAAAPRKKWGWIVNVVLIGLGCTSCACLPAAIPLLIFWLKPETKQWYRA